MDTCEFQSCSLFIDLNEKRPALLKKIKEKYCDSDFSACARYMVFKALGPGHVPRYLFPGHATEACKIIDEFNESIAAPFL
jgi:hypothetical protein